MPVRYDHVEFKSWSKDSQQMETVCTVSLVDGKLHYEGKEAEMVKKLVDKNRNLEPYRKLGGYSLLSQFCHTFKGTYFWATDVQEASIL